MFRIRFLLKGSSKNPVLHIVAVDSRKKRNGGFKYKLGFFDKISKILKIDYDLYNKLIKEGAQPTGSVLKKIRTYGSENKI